MLYVHLCWSVVNSSEPSTQPQLDENERETLNMHSFRFFTSHRWSSHVICTPDLIGSCSRLLIPRGMFSSDAFHASVVLRPYTRISLIGFCFDLAIESLGWLRYGGSHLWRCRSPLGCSEAHCSSSVRFWGATLKSYVMSQSELLKSLLARTPSQICIQCTVQRSTYMYR